MKSFLASMKASALGKILLPSRAIHVPADLVAGFDTNGSFSGWHNGVQFMDEKPNIVPDAFRSYALKAALAGFSQTTAWFLVPWINDIEPTNALTAANFDATLDEFINYDETTRRAWTQDAEASQAISNAGAMATITCSVGGGVINGIALVSVSTKNSAAGLLAAASSFATRTMVEGDTLQFKYTMRNQSAA